MINVLIVDDELLARENIILRLHAHPTFEVCGQADNGHDALLLASRLQPDVIFLDVQMPGMDGMEAAAILKEQSNAIIIFITAYGEHALKAFRVDALDYLVKPIDDDQFADTLARITKRVALKRDVGQTRKAGSNSETYLHRLGIKDGKTISMVDVTTIEYIEAAGDYLCIYSGGKTHIQRQTLKALLDLLDPAHFLRIHRSHVINTKYLTAITQDENGLIAEMQAGKTLNISRRFQKAARQHVSQTSSPSNA